MYIDLKLLQSIKDDAKKLEEYVNLHNEVQTAIDEIVEFYRDYFDDYASCGEYDEQEFDRLWEQHDAVVDKFSRAFQ